MRCGCDAVFSHFCFCEGRVAGLRAVRARQGLESVRHMQTPAYLAHAQSRASHSTKTSLVPPPAKSPPRATHVYAHTVSLTQHPPLLVTSCCHSVNPPLLSVWPPTPAPSTCGRQGLTGVNVGLGWLLLVRDAQVHVAGAARRREQRILQLAGLLGERVAQAFKELVADGVVDVPPTPHVH